MLLPVGLLSQRRSSSRRTGSTPLSLETLAAVSEVLKDAQHADSTKRTRSAQMRTYFRFTDEVGIRHFPPSPRETVLYASWLMLTTCSRSDSLRQYLAALRVHAARLGHWVPSPTEFPDLQAVVKGAARLFPGPSRRSLPVTPAILVNLLNTVPPPRASRRQIIILQVLKDTALLLFLTMLRGSNLFPSHPAAADPVRNLTWNKIRRTDNGVIITVTLSKTIQSQERVHEIPLAAAPGSMFCPVQALERLYSHRSTAPAPTDHVLVLPNEDGPFSPLVKYQFLKWFRSRLDQMGLDSSRYHVHGYRHGAIQCAILSGNNITLIKLHSDHLSDAIMCYSHVEPEKRGVITESMISALDLQSRS